MAELCLHDGVGRVPISPPLSSQEPRPKCVLNPTQSSRAPTHSLASPTLLPRRTVVHMGTRTEQMIGGRIVAWSDHLFLAWAVAEHVRVAQRG